MDSRVSSFLRCPQSCWWLFWHFRWCSQSNWPVTMSMTHLIGFCEPLSPPIPASKMSNAITDTAQKHSYIKSKSMDNSYLICGPKLLSAITMYQQYLVLVYWLYSWLGVMKQFPFLPDCEEPVQSDITFIIVITNISIRACCRNYEFTVQKTPSVSLMLSFSLCLLYHTSVIMILPFCEDWLLERMLTRYVVVCGPQGGSHITDSQYDNGPVWQAKN